MFKKMIFIMFLKKNTEKDKKYCCNFVYEI